MQDKLKIAIVQSDLLWEDPEANRIRFTDHINRFGEKSDLILLPEMFTTGFTMNPEGIAENMEGETVKWMLNTAKNMDSAIGGSLVINEENEYYNRFIFVKPDGTIETYDKRHTFTLAGEDKAYKAGTDKVIIDYKGWRICPLICYDLRFPVWARNKEDYDVLFYVANWPQPRIDAWDALLKARAIENMSYCIGVNRVGTDANGHNYTGHSAAYDGLGNLLSDFEDGIEEMKLVTLTKEHLNSIRTNLRFLDDRDRFSLTTENR